MTLDRDDPLDVFLTAQEEMFPGVRDAGYRRAIALAHQQAEDWPEWVVASIEARAMCGLARDRAVTIQEAERAVERAVAAGESCASLLALIDAYADLGDPAAVLATVRRLPRTCFRGIFSDWRFHIWNQRVDAASKVGATAELLHYAALIVDRMERYGGDVEESLMFYTPYRTVEALLALVDASNGAAGRARQLLFRLAALPELEEWFGDDIAAAITAAAAP